MLVKDCGGRDGRGGRGRESCSAEKLWRIGESQPVWVLLNNCGPLLLLLLKILAYGNDE